MSLEVYIWRDEHIKYLVDKFNIRNCIEALKYAN